MMKMIDSKNKGHILDHVVTATEFERINGEKTIQLTSILTQENTMLFRPDNIIEGDDLYDISVYRKAQSEEGELIAEVEGEHISYRLNDPSYYMESYIKMDTPEVILTELLQGTDFTVGTVEFTDVITYSQQEKLSRRLLVMDLVSYLGGEIVFDRFKISIVQRRGSSITKSLTDGRNVEIVEEYYDKYDTDEHGNPRVSYICQLIEPININLGDSVSLKYETLAIDIELRVVSISKDPTNCGYTEFEIGNFVSGLEDEARIIETTTLKKGKKYYGARISPENGFESTRGDLKARTIMNADQIVMQKGDGQGNWTNVLYFDAEQGEFVFLGKVDFTGLVTFNDLKTAGKTEINGDNIKTGKIKAIDVVGSKFYGPSETSAYLVIGAEGNTGDLTLVRGGTGGNFFRIRDGLPGIFLQSGNGSTWHDFLSAFDGKASPKGVWDFNGATIENFNIDGLYAVFG